MPMATGAIDERVLRALQEAVPGGVRAAVDLADISRWRIGGMADAFIEPADERELIAAFEVLADAGAPYCVIGETSNLLFDSEGMRGAIVRIGPRMSGITIDGLDVVTKAGTRVPELARAVGEAGLTGIEHTVGIPGTIGGLVLMNGGSQRKGIGSHVAWVRYVNADGTTSTLTRDECAFAYRTSVLQQRRGAVVEVGLRLEEGDRRSIVAEMDAIVASRAARFPEDEPNCGSTFLSNPAMYATVGPPGRAIEDAGLKGHQIGGAQVSPKHANFICNVGGATSDDVLRLIALIRSAVQRQTGYALDAEAKYVTTEGEMMSAHNAAWRSEP